MYLRPLGTTGRNINSSQTRSAVLQQGLKGGSPEIRGKKMGSLNCKQAGVEKKLSRNGLRFALCSAFLFCNQGTREQPVW